MERLILLGLYVNFFIYLEFSCFPFRNSAVETVEQELLFVGSETGKLLAMRELVKKVYLDYLLEFG